MPRIWLLLACAVILWPASARGEDSRLAARLPATIRAQIEALVDSAAIESLPREPLVQHALEGMTKGADGEQIVRAVRSLLVRLRDSRQVLGDKASQEELVASAHCLQVGADTSDIRELQEVREKDTLVVPLVVLADLIGRGTPVDLAAQATRALLQARVEDRALLEMRKQVEQDILSGKNASVALTQRARAFLPEDSRNALEGVSPDELRERDRFR